MPAVRDYIRQEDWSEGMSRDVAPALIGPAGAYDIVNGLLDEAGSIYRRGGTEYKSEGSGAEKVLDDFNRANEDPVSKAGKWIGAFTPLGAGNLAVVEEALEISSGTSGSAVYNQSVADGFLTATVKALTAGGRSVSLLMRTASESESAKADGYQLLVNNGGETADYALYRCTNGAYTFLGFQVGKLEAGDAVGLKAIGSEISAWRKPSGGEWERLLAVSDGTYTSGNVGVVIESWTATPRLEDFSLTDLTNFSTSGLTWITDVYLQPGRRTVFADSANFGVLASDDEEMLNLGGAGLTLPKQSAVIEDLLFVGGGAIYGGSRKTAEYKTGKVKVTKASKTVTGKETKWEANVDAGMLFQIGSERVYIVASVQSDTELTLRDAYEGETGEEKAYALHSIYAVGLDPYETWDFLTVCANRLVLASGRVLKFTEVNNPHTFTNSLATTNEHKLPAGVETVGLATIGQTVLWFTTAGIWVLDGLALSIVDLNGNSQHRLQQLSTDTVLAGAAGLAGSEQSVVVPAADGVYLMDGISDPRRISKPIDNLYRKRIKDGYRIGRAIVFRSHYFLPIIDGSADVRDLFVCRLDRPTRSRSQGTFPWTRFTGDGGEIAAFAVRATTDPREPLLLGAQARGPSRVVDCSSYFSPGTAHRNDADGTTHDLEIITRDIETGQGTINAVRALKPRYELVGDGATLRAYYSDGSLKSIGAIFGESIFGKAQFGGAKEVFTPIGEAGENDGRDPARFRVNQKLRYGRFQLKSAGPAASCVLRSIELTTRPSGATRR